MNAPVTVCGVNTLDTTTAARCPVCSTPGKKVRPETVKNLLKNDKIPNLLEGYSLCLSRECDVVYFGQQIFRKKDVKVRVWYKVTEHPIPVCYCKKRYRERYHGPYCCSRLLQRFERHSGTHRG